MRALFGLLAFALLLTTGCTTKNIGDAFVTQVTCEQKGDYWVDDRNGCLSEGQVLTWLESACYCETYLACEDRGFPEFGVDGSGCDAETYEWVDGDESMQSDLASLDLPEGAVMWDQVQDVIGEEATVCGDIAGANRAETSKQTPTNIDLGKRFPDINRVTVVIWGKDLTKFESDPKDEYARGSICVTGEVSKKDGIVTVEVDNPEQILKLR